MARTSCSFGPLCTVSQGLSLLGGWRRRRRGRGRGEAEAEAEAAAEEEERVVVVVEL